MGTARELADFIRNNGKISGSSSWMNSIVFLSFAMMGILMHYMGLSENEVYPKNVNFKWSKW